MNLRRLAAQVLLEVLKEGHSLTAALETLADKVTVGKDRALIQAMCFGVCRHYQWLDAILVQLMSKPLRQKDLDIQMLLLLGLYQLSRMRVKEHAAVSETVAAVNKKVWAKPLINAVLRQFLRDRDTLETSLNNDVQAHYSHPLWMLDLIRQDWPEQAEAILQANNRPAPMVLRVNFTRVSREDYLNQLKARQIAAQAVEFCDSAIILERPVNVEDLPGFADGWLSVQDTAAQLAARLLAVQPGDRVLDLCAAPGGKTAAILESQPQLKAMLAVDVDGQRLQKIEQNLLRLGLSANVLQADAATPQHWAKGQLFDRILLDAPCSALGVIRRHPDIKLLRRETDLAELCRTQRTMLDAAWGLLSPGGVLLYATCSVAKRENEEQIAAFLQRHSDAEEMVIAAEWGSRRPLGRQILSGVQHMDGFYYAKLRKVI